MIGILIDVMVIFILDYLHAEHNLLISLLSDYDLRIRPVQDLSHTIQVDFTFMLNHVIALVKLIALN